MAAPSKKSARTKESIYLIIALVITLSSIFYWLAITTHAYKTFQDGTADLTLYSYNMYFNIHYPSIVSGLQFMVFSNHISPDALLLLPIFYLSQSSLTLLYIQIVIICLTALLVFYIAKKLIGDSSLAIILSIAFLLNPGVTGILTFDFHIEFLLVPTYLLAFYFYMKSNRKLFAISLILLLGAVEEAPVLALTMGLGLLVYELSKVNFKWKLVDKTKRAMLWALFISAIITGILYYAAIKYLISSYATAYTNLPAPLQITTGSEIGLLSNLHSTLSNPLSFIAGGLSVFYINPVALYFLILSAMIVLFGFGFFTLKKPIVTFLLLLPWVIAVLTWFGRIHFIYTGYQYYSYSIGATLSAAIIGAIVTMEKIGKSGKNIGLEKAIIGFSVIVMALLLMFASLFIAARPALFLITYNVAVPNSTFNPNQIYPLISLVPQNASLMTQDVISPHLADRKYIEFTVSNETNGTYFVPDYILVNYKNGTDVYTNKSFDFFDRAITNNTYELYARNGNARLYVRT